MHACSQQESCIDNDSAEGDWLLTSLPVTLYRLGVGTCGTENFTGDLVSSGNVNLKRVAAIGFMAAHHNANKW